MRELLLKHVETLGLNYSANELNDTVIEDKLALHFVDFYNEKEPLKRWQHYYDMGIRCVFIYPTYNASIYKNIISYHFGKVKKVFARKCEVRIVKASSVQQFFEDNNIEGYRMADKAYCLYYNDELLMAYSVGHAFFGKGKYDLEIARGACKMGYQIVGGASKLWKHIIADNPLVQTIVYYVDRREYDGRSMKFLDNVDKTNFGGESFMNYWVNTNEYRNREPARNAEITKGYKDGSIIQVKNPGSWTNIYTVEPNRFYVYKVTNKKDGRYYIGSKVSLNADNYYIGYNYFTSSTDKEFTEDFKHNTMKWKHEVLAYFDDKQECLDYEAELIEEAWNNDKEHLINRGWFRKSKSSSHVVCTNTPEVVAKRKETIARNWNKLTDEEKAAVKAKQSAIAKERMSNEASKQRMINSLKTYYKLHPIVSKYDSINKLQKLCEPIEIIEESKDMSHSRGNRKGYGTKFRNNIEWDEERRRQTSELTKRKMAEAKARDTEHIHSMGYVTVEDLLAEGWTRSQIGHITAVGKYKKLKYYKHPE